MGKRFEGKVALISGAGRGQGRTHALRLAEEGADIIAFDVCRQLDTTRYPLASPEDLKETARQVEALGQRAMTRELDVRDSAGIRQLIEDGVSEFGRLDVVCANAAFVSLVENTWSITDEEWDELVGVVLTGVWKTVKAAIPAMIEAGNGGAIILTSSTAGIKGLTNLGHYVAAKHGVIGLMRVLANELAEHMIRVNVMIPGAVDTKMNLNDHVEGWVAAHPGWGQNWTNAMPVEWIKCQDVSNAVAWLASDEARYVTGMTLPVDAGFLVK